VPLLALLPILNAKGSLSFGALLLLVAAAGVFTAPYLACQRVILPSIVGESESAVAQANAVVGGASTAGALLGAPVGGLLIAALGPMKVVWIDAASYLAAFLIVLALVRTRHRPGDEEAEPGVFAGLRYVVRDPLIRGVSLVVMLSGFWFPVLVVSLPVYAFEHGADPRVAGWLFFAFSAGTFVGSIVSYRVLGRVPPMRLARFALVWIATSLCLLAFNLPVAAMVAVLGLGALLVPSANAPAFTLLTLAPEGVRAKVTTAVLTMNTAIMPLGYLVGGLVISRLGLRAAFILVAALAVLTTIIFWRVSTRAEALDPSLATASDDS
jgi:predicted MFS family arabinose efflux permease